MTSLAETYGARGSRARKRLLAGTGLFLAGALMIVAGIVIGSTEVLSAYGIGTYGAREIAGIVGGLGVPAVFVGVFTVLPASRRERAAAAVGSAIAILGVVLFWYAYPGQWSGAAAETDLTLPVATVYFVGVLTTFWTLFTAIVNVKATSPGGTVTLQRIIRRAAGSTTPGSHRPGSKPTGPSGGSVGVAGGLGNDARTGTAADGRSGGTSAGTVSDGGTGTETLGTPDPEPEETGREEQSPDAPTAAGSAGTSGASADPDRYCGSCTHFQYVRADAGMQPYCGFHDELMDDMEACEEWEPNATAGTYDGI